MTMGRAPNRSEAIRIPGTREGRGRRVMRIVGHMIHNGRGDARGVPLAVWVGPGTSPYVPSSRLWGGELELGRDVPVSSEGNLGGDPARPPLLGGSHHPVPGSGRTDPMASEGRGESDGSKTVADSLGSKVASGGNRPRRPGTEIRFQAPVKVRKVGWMQSLVDIRGGDVVADGS